MNIFASPDSIDTRFPLSSPEDIKIAPDGQSNSGKAGRSVRLHERVPLIELSDAERDKFLHVYDGEQLYHSPETVVPLDGSGLFNEDASLYWDYGCGRGERVIDMASRHPDNKYVGVDIHYRSLALGVRAAASARLDNVRFIRGDVDLLSRLVPTESAMATSIMFPAPRPNNQHGFNGMPSPSLAREIHRALEDDGAPLEFSSDSEPYFNYRMRQIGLLGLFSCESNELRVGVNEADYPTRYQKLWESKGIPTYSAILRKVIQEED